MVEYKVISENTQSVFEKMLNEFGRKGWVLVTSYPRGDRNTGFVAIMEKKDK